MTVTPDETSTSSPLVVRRTRAEDWAALRAIRLEALADTPDAFGSTYHGTLEHSDERWRTLVVEQCYFLAERGGRVVGMISGGLNERCPGTHWIYGMYVTPSARGTGVAERLVEAVVAWARAQGAPALFLQVTGSLPRARAFYARAGFVPTGERMVMHRDARLELVTLRKELVDD